MKEQVELVRKGELPSIEDLLQSIEELIPRYSQLADTPQDSEWHGEGNVRIHTRLVLEEVYRLIASGGESFDEEERVAIVFGAAFHDVGKVFTTCEREVEGKIRIVSPHHTDRGRSYIAPLLGQSALRAGEIFSVLGLVRHHHDPKMLVMRSAERSQYARLARVVNHRLLYLLERCDLLGRISSHLESQLEVLELFRLESENFGLWNCPDPYLEWKERIASEIPEAEGRDYVVGELIREYELGQIQSPEEAIAKTWEHRQNHALVTMVCAPPGVGKSTWIANHLSPDATIISLDRIREELTGKQSDQSKNGQVLQVAREQLREALRGKRNAVWDATSLRRDGRSVVLSLAHNYHAATRVVTLGVTPEVAGKQNKNRENQIPQSVVSKLYARWQWPDIWEAHRVDVIYP